MGTDRRTDRRTRKTRFITQSPAQYIQQIERIVHDDELSSEDKTHILNKVRLAAMRDCGFYSVEFTRIDAAISAALKQCEKCSEVVTDG